MKAYRSNFLTNVIARVDYSPIFRMNTEDPAAFQELLRMEFPRSEKQQTVEVILAAGEVKQNTASGRWQFWTNEKDRVITIDAQSITYEETKYRGYTDFRKTLLSVHDSFNKVYAPGLVTRIGLRYINQIKIDGDPFSWKGYIQDNLIATISETSYHGMGLARSMSQVHLVGDYFNVLMQFGAYNSEYPNTLSKKEFVLDFDCHSREERGFNDCTRVFDQFHDVVGALFEGSIGESLREIMRGEDNG